MRQLPLLTLATLLALPACQLKAPEVVKTGASARPAAVHSAAPPPTPPKLLKAGPGTITLSGQVFMDAGYARAHANGRTVGTAIGMDGATVISNDGASLANSGGQIVAQGAGNVIVPPGVISNDGASLVGNDGASIISNDGGGLIGNDGASYQLAEADAEGLGQTSPAAGMWLSVVDGRTGDLVPLGVDDQGQPVTAIYTNAEGRFTVHLPASLAANVRVVARAPGSTDPRLALHVLETPKLAARAVDEPTAAATGYLRYLFADLMVKLANSSPERVASLLSQIIPQDNGDAASKFLLQALMGPLGTVRDAMAAAKLKDLPSAAQYDVCLRAADLVLADMDLAGTKLDFSIYKPLDGAAAAKAGQPAFDVFIQQMAEVRAAAARDAGSAVSNQQAFSAFFAAKPYLVAANAAHPGTCRVLAKPADLCDFVVKEYFATADLTHISVVDHVFYDLGTPAAVRDLMRTSGLNLYVEVMQRLISQPEEGDNLATQIASLITREAPLANGRSAPAAAPPACPAASTAPGPAPIGRVVTLAGPMDGKPVGLEVDGAGAKARFNAPRALTYDPATNVAYVADGNAATLRRVRFDADGAATVETLRTGVGPYDGLLVAGNTLYAAGADLHKVVSFALPDGAGPLDVATGGGGPVGLAMDLEGNLLVADQLDHQVKRVMLQGGAPTLVGFYGTGEPRMLDATEALKACIDSPRLLAVSPAGTLYVASFGEGQIHTVDLKTGRTNFLAGGRGLDDHPDGFWANAQIDVPRGLAFDPAGRLVLADGLSRLRTVSLNGDVQTILGQRLDATNHPLRGFKDGPADQALAGVISSVAVLPGGAILFTDENGALREWLPN